MPTNTATPSTMPAVVSTVRRMCLRKYGQLIRRSRIMRRRDRRSPDVLDDAAVAQRDRPAAALGDVHVVRHDHDGRAEPGVQIADQREDLLAGVRVEIAGRFVGEQNRRIDRQRARDRDALALAAGQFLGQMLQAMTELHQRRAAPSRARCTFAPRPAAQMQRQPDVLETRQRRQQIEELKDESDLVAPHPGQRLVGQAAERFAVDADVAGGRPIETANQIEQRRLAGAGRSDDRHHLAARNGQGDVVERGHLAFAGELLGDAVEVDHGLIM